MTANELRKKFLQFFKEKGHAVIPSASLIPENDPTILFTTAGMHPLVPYLKGEKHPLGRKLTDAQKCIRTVDIDNVGDDSHLTFFEMLGYWSLGDYWKKESIHYTFDFYIKILGFDKKNISVTVFAGDKVAPFDEESFDAWKDEIGIPDERIYRYAAEENWWGLASGIGPCGPCTEMFIDTGKKSCGKKCGPSCSCGKFIEIGNNVFIEYLKNADGSIEKLKQKNVDVGLGLERLAMFNQGKKSVYDTELFQPIIEKIEELSGKNYEEHEKEFRIITDHIKAATMVLGDDKAITPSNVGAGYILRRLIRRAIRHGKTIGIENNFISAIADTIIKIYQDVYPEVLKNKKFVIDQLDIEEEKFRKTLLKGLKEFEKLKTIDGKIAFDLYQTYGFPVELTEELSQEKGLKIDKKVFAEEFKKHQNLSRTASAGMFKGGLADASEQTVKYHTATHLLLAAMRQILSPEIYQKGSNITAERMRFDFNYPQKLTKEQIREIENLVNQKIQENIPVELIMMPKTEALKIAKVSFDPAKYGDTVKVYRIGDFSIELCGGPHVGNTGELGKFIIAKEEASSAGVRRIKAVLE